METETHVLGEEVVVSRFFGNLDDSQADLFDAALKEGITQKQRVIVDLGHVYPLSAKNLMLLLQFSKRVRKLKGACHVLPPSWMNDAQAAGSLDLKRYGFSLVDSVRQGLDQLGFPGVSDELPKSEKETGDSDDLIPGDGGKGGALQSLQDGLSYYFGSEEVDEDGGEEGEKQKSKPSLPSTASESIGELEPDEMEEAAGGLFQAIGDGIRYYLGKDKK